VMGATALAEPNEELVETPQIDLPASPSDSSGLGLPSPQPSAGASPAVSSGGDRLRNAVIQTLVDGNQRILASMLEAGEWSVEGNEVVIKISESQTVVDMSFGGDARRLATASASGVLGKPAKLKIIPNANVAAPEKRNGGQKQNGGPAVNGRSRAESDAVVRRLQEKFGAQIRTVIDYKEKR
jgi:hypothetical protein